MNNQSVNHQEHGATLIEALRAVEQALHRTSLDPRLRHLIVLRASQINRCGFCVRMHARQAREAGETNERLDHLSVWPHCADYSAREKAALAWTEALTLLQPHTDYAALRAGLRAHFSEAEIAALTTSLGMINLWNRLQVANH